MADDKSQLKVQPRKRSAYDDRGDDAEASAGGTSKASLPKATIIFSASPGRLSCRAVVRRNIYGHAVEEIVAESPEAATHWREEDWRPLPD